MGVQGAMRTAARRMAGTVLRNKSPASGAQLGCCACAAYGLGSAIGWTPQSQPELRCYFK